MDEVRARVRAANLIGAGCRKTLSVPFFLSGTSTRRHVRDVSLRWRPEL